MTTYRTGNAIGSADPRDLYDNAENLDELVNSQDKAEHPDRLGVPRKTWHGIEEDFQSFLQLSGYQDLGDYAPGIEITARNQIIRADGELWRISASTDLPYTTDGSGMPEGGAFVSVGDAVLRQELADPTQGGELVKVTTSTGEQTLAEALDNRVIYVDTIADLQALPTSELVDGQQVQVKEYNAGTGVGGGSFYWDSVSLEDGNGFTVLEKDDGSGVFKRVPTNYVDVNILGGDSYIGDPLEGLQILVDHAVSGGTVSTEGWSGEKEFDSKLVIDKPVKLKSHPGVSFRLADQSNIFHSGAGRNSERIIEIISSDASVDGFIIDFNKLNNYVTFGGVNYYFLENTQDIGATDEEFRYLRGIEVTGDASGIRNVSILNNTLINCSVHAIGVNGGHPSDHGIPDLSNPSIYASNITVEGNTISGGCRSGVFFINGVINSSISNNTSYNWAWSSFRFYNMTNKCVMENNAVIIDKDVPLSEYENSTTDIARSYFQGYKIGHGSRSPGTCDNSLINSNTYEAYGLSNIRIQAIVIESEVPNVICTNNRVNEEGGSGARLLEEPCVYILSKNNISFSNNNIKTSNPMGLVVNVVEAGEGLVSIRGNYFSHENSDDTAIGFCIRKASGLSGVQVGAVSIVKENTIEGFNSGGVLDLLGAKNSQISNNYFVNCDAIDPLVSDGTGVIYISSPSTGVYDISGNTIEMTEGHSAGTSSAVRITSAGKGILRGNTAIVDTGFIGAFTVSVSADVLENENLSFER